MHEPRTSSARVRNASGGLATQPVESGGDDAHAKGRPIRGPGYSVDFWKWYEEFAVPRLKSWPVPPDHSRADTFRMMFEHLDRFDRPLMIIETGCAERLNDDGWGANGGSPLLFDHYERTHQASSCLSA